jgi:hypothetical protein
MIEIGRDSILGLGNKSMLSPPLLARLHSKGFHFLYQLKHTPSRGQIGENWINGTFLKLEPDLEAEWNRLHTAINWSRNPPSGEANSLIWTGGDNTGIFTVKNAYHAIATKFWRQHDEAWRKKLWKGDCPMKIKLFIWLLTENKLLVWDNLQTVAGRAQTVAYCVNWKANRSIIYLCSAIFSAWSGNNSHCFKSS